MTDALLAAPVEPPADGPVPGPAGHSRSRAIVTRAWRQDRAATIWLVVFVVVVVVVVIGPVFLQSDTLVNPGIRLETSSSAHLLGTDDLGRDIFSREVSAGRVSLGIGAIVTLVSVVAGLVIGMFAGFYPRADGPVMRIVDALLAFPPLVLAIALVVFLGNGAGSEILALGVVYTPYLARIARASTVSLRERVYVMAARSSGQSGPRILLTHILPNSMPTILVQASFVYASALLSDAALSFLGLGVAPPTPTWGNMVAEARPYITTDPFFIVYPGVAIVVVVMALNLIGDGVRDLLDPRTRALVELEQLRSRTRRRVNQALATAAPDLVTAAGLLSDGTVPDRTSLDGTTHDQDKTDG
jgi:peptide/nickel transport system permease protein